MLNKSKEDVLRELMDYREECKAKNFGVKERVSGFNRIVESAIGDDSTPSEIDELLTYVGDKING